LKLFVASLVPGGTFGLTISVKKNHTLSNTALAIIKFLYVLKRNKQLGVQICNIMPQTARCWSVSTQVAVPRGSASSHSYNLKQSYNHTQSFIFKMLANVHVETEMAECKWALSFLYIAA
jgi:hypothetical protein